MFKFLWYFLIVLGAFLTALATTATTSHQQQVKTSSISKYGSIIGHELSRQNQCEGEPNNRSSDSLEASSSNGTQSSETRFTGGHDELRSASMVHRLIKQDIYGRKQVDDSYRIYTDLDAEFDGIYTIAEISLAALITRFQTIAHNDMLMHRYDSFRELKKSTGRHVNNELCLRQLIQLNREAEQSKELKLSTRDFNFYRLIDTYGKVPAGLLSGNLFWPGMYEACLSLSIESPPPEIGVTSSSGHGDKKMLPTRYCLATLKYNNRKWPNEATPLNRMLTFKAGICLPQACDSLRFKNKYELIKRLIDYNGREFDRDETSLDNLYCLPDDDSPMRMWWKSPRVMQAILVFCSWISLIIYATIRYERLKHLNTSTTNEFQSCDDHSQSSEATTSSQQDMKYGTSAPFTPDSYNKIFEMLAITINFKLLFVESSQRSSKLEETDSKTMELRSDEYSRMGRHVVNFGCLNGIKVIGILCILSGNVLISLSSQVNNPRELNYLTNLAYWIGNMFPDSMINSFFTITGTLTCYHLFRGNQVNSFVARPIEWIGFITYRYLRIMSVYAVVVYYCKYLSKYTGSGPMWDYGTSSLAPRRQCEEESWLWTLLLGANFKSPLEHCIPSAWYLANDFQFFLVTPIYLIALYKRPEFGQKLLKFCILVGYLAGIVSIYAADMPDMRPFAKFMPHSYRSFIYFLGPVYSGPLFRMPAYLCGLLFGYNLHLYEQDRLKYLADNSTATITGSGQTNPYGWPKWFSRHGLKLSLSLMFLCLIIPIVGTMIQWDKFHAQLWVAFLMPTLHLMIALATGIITLVSVTGHANKLFQSCMSASFWTPVAKLSLCVSLINIEAINYLIQMRRLQTYMEFQTYAGFNLLGITMTYLCAIIVHLLFEAPTKAIVLFVSDRLASKSKKIS